MYLKSGFYRVAVAFCLVLSITLLTFADTIRLKDGSIIKGKIVNFGDGKFTVLIGEGSRQRQMVFFADEVDSIEFDGASGITTVKTSLPAKTSSSNSDETKTIPSKTVIVTDNTKTQPTPTPTPIPTPAVQNKTVITNNPTNTTPKPIIVNVKVLADNTANGWTNSQWVVKKGQKIRITGKGQVNLGNGRFTSPAGITSLSDKDKLMQNEATGALIAVIGDDNNEFIFIGASREFTAQRDGALFLGVNEGNLDDNSGAFDVVIEVQPN
jgi:hypothetical protein